MAALVTRLMKNNALFHVLYICIYFMSFSMVESHGRTADRLDVFTMLIK